MSVKCLSPKGIFRYIRADDLRRCKSLTSRCIMYVARPFEDVFLQDQLLMNMERYHDCIGQYGSGGVRLT